MKYYTILLIGLLFTFNLGCSNDDSSDNLEDFYMSAKVDGANYYMTGKDSQLTAKKLVGPSGILKLQVSAFSGNGQHIKFVVADYMGEGIYLIGENPMLPTYIEIGDVQPFGLWTCHNPGPNDFEKNFIQITSDMGDIVEGKFDFSGQNFEDNTMKKVQEGKFRMLSH